MRADSLRTAVVCSNYAWTVVNFRLPLIIELKKRGYRVEVITQFDGCESNLEPHVDAMLPLNISRKGVNPLQECVTFFDLAIKLRRIQPDVALFFTIKPVIYGCVAARVCRVPAIATITGLGTAFISDSLITMFSVS